MSDVTNKAPDVSLQQEVEVESARFQALMRASLGVLYRMGPDWSEMWQLGGGEFLRCTDKHSRDWLQEYIYPDDQTLVQATIQQAIATRSVFNLDHRVWRADGSVGWVQSRAVPLLDANGEITEWLGAASDITERKRNETSVRDSEERFRALFASSSAPFLLLAPDSPRFTIMDVNKAYLEATMTTREKLLGRGVFEMFPDNPGDPDIAGVRELRAAFERALASRRPTELQRLKYDVTRPDGSFEERWWRPINTPLLDAAGKVVALIHHATDVTEMERAERILRESAERQAFLLRLSDDIRAQFSEDEVGALVVHRLAEHLRLDRCYLARLFPEEDRVIVGPEYRRADFARASGEYRLSDFPEVVRRVQTRTAVFDDVAGDPTLSEADKAGLGSISIGAFVNASVRRGDERVLWSLVVISAVPRVWTPGEVSLVENVAERTWAALERARAGKALRESEEKYRTLFETMDQGFCLIEKLETASGEPSDYRYLVANPAFERHTGMRDVVGKTIRQFVPNAEISVMECYDRVVRTGKPDRIEEYIHELNLWMEAEVFPAEAPGRIAVLFSNVNERKRAEEALRESEQRFRLFVENVQEYALVQTDTEGKITSWNPGAQRMFQYAPDEIVGQDFSVLLNPEDYKAGVFRKELAFVSKGNRNEDARWFVRKDGSRLFTRWITEPIHDDHGVFRGLAKVMRDETEREAAEALIRKSLAEKEELLREAHHRVKNNLQVITSLLNLQSATITDLDILGLFQETRNRVQSIASIHELLYRSSSLAAIELAPSARQLTADLVTFYGAQGRIDTKVVGDGVAIDLERAVPFGLLLNELVSNALKHGFPDGRKGELRVEIGREHDETVLRVIDNGIGLPPQLDYRQSASLGLKLVHILARQMRATVKLLPIPGTCFELRIPAALPNRENN